MPGPLSMIVTRKRVAWLADGASPLVDTTSSVTTTSGRIPASSDASRALSTASLTQVRSALRGLSKPSRWRFLVKNSETEISRWRAPISTAETTVAISFCDIRRALGGPPYISLFDHLVGPGEQRRWDRHAQRLGRLEVDDQLELGRLLDRQVARPGALQDLVHEDGRALGHRQQTRAIGHEGPGQREFPEIAHRGQSVLRGKVGDDFPGQPRGHRIGQHDHGLHTLVHHDLEGLLDLGSLAGLDGLRRDP